jgi:hypothetical protein
MRGEVFVALHGEPRIVLVWMSLPLRVPGEVGVGYTTEFSGQFRLDRKLAPEHEAYLRAFNEARHMRFNMKRVGRVPDSARAAAELPIGPDGAYCVFTRGAQTSRNLVLEDVSPLGPNCSRYCGWVPTDDGSGLTWDGGDKFEGYATWLAFVVEHFLDRWGYALRGAVAWQGETDTDRGVLFVRNNKIVVGGGEHPHCAAGAVPENMRFRGRFGVEVDAAVRLGGYEAVNDLLRSGRWPLRL